MISAKAFRALNIVWKHGMDAPGYGMTPAIFARHMWPDSPLWQQSAPAGHGSHVGGGMYRPAGAYLGRLVLRGLIYHGVYGWHVTADGLRAIREYETAHPLDKDSAQA